MKYTIAREIGIKQITKANVVVILKDFLWMKAEKKRYKSLLTLT